MMKKYKESYFCPTCSGLQRGRVGMYFAKIRARVLQWFHLLLRAIESDAKLPETRVDFRKRSRKWDGISIGTGLRGVLEQKDYHSLVKVSPFLVAFIDRRSEYKKRASVTKVHLRSSSK